MTATDELRKLLDERGVEYEAERIDSSNYFTWGENDCYSYTEYPDGTVLRIWDCTPEQAIAATLGSHERTTKMYRDEHGIWHCTACERGADVITGNDGELDSWHDSWAPNYCPYCGRMGEQ